MYKFIYFGVKLVFFIHLKFAFYVFFVILSNLII